VACTSPTGMDRKLSSPTSAVAVPRQTQAKPVVGDCYTVLGSDLLASERVPCSVHHRVEVAYIGTFTGSAAAVDSPPVANSAAMRGAYAKCAGPTAAYVGGDWHLGLMDLELLIPDLGAWRGGARWFRCDLLGLTSLDYESLGGSDVSFRGVLAKPSPLSARCITWLGTQFVSNIEPVSCTSRHRAEFAGTYTAPVGPWPASAKEQTALADDGREHLVARFVGFPSWQQFDNPHVGYFELGFDERQWYMGDRSVRCYAAAFTTDGQFVGSVKGIRSRTPKG